MVEVSDVCLRLNVHAADDALRHALKLNGYFVSGYRNETIAKSITNLLVKPIFVVIVAQTEVSC